MGNTGLMRFITILEFYSGFVLDQRSLILGHHVRNRAPPYVAEGNDHYHMYICYMDDTLIVVEGDKVEAVLNRANAALATVSGHVRELGLRVAVDKTEAEIFRNRHGPAEPQVRIQGQAVALRETLKYLSVTLENKRLMFGAH